MSEEFTRDLLRSSAAVAITSAFVVVSIRGQACNPTTQGGGACNRGCRPARSWADETSARQGLGHQGRSSNCTQTGFEHIELRTTHAHGVEVKMSKEQRQTVRKRFENAGLKISLASGFAYHYPDPAQLRKEIEGTGYVILAGTSGPSAPHPNALPGAKDSEENPASDWQGNWRKSPVRPRRRQDRPRGRQRMFIVGRSSK
jgi:hypothetical protein